MSTEKFGLHSLALVSSLLLTLPLIGCSSDNNDNDNDNTGDSGTSEVDYQITVTNLTANQPISPVGIVLHDGSHVLWRSGQAASVDLEHLAEGGNNTPWLETAVAGDSLTVTGAGPIGPGAHEILHISSNRSGLHFLTVAGMLVNTNDAFSGSQGLDLSQLESGEQLAQLALVYDAGTEANSERVETLPGPAGGGEGYSAVRDDLRDAVRIHAGVIGADDGLADSALNATHRFDNPTMRIVVERQ